MNTIFKTLCLACTAIPVLAIADDGTAESTDVNNKWYLAAYYQYDSAGFKMKNNSMHKIFVRECQGTKQRSLFNISKNGQNSLSYPSDINKINYLTYYVYSNNDTRAEDGVAPDENSAHNGCDNPTRYDDSIKVYFYKNYLKYSDLAFTKSYNADQHFIRVHNGDTHGMCFYLDTTKSHWKNHVADKKSHDFKNEHDYGHHYYRAGYRNRLYALKGSNCTQNSDEKLVSVWIKLNPNRIIYDDKTSQPPPKHHGGGGIVA